MILLAESGSTKTDWRLIDKQTIRSFETAGLNPYFVTSDTVAEAISVHFPNETPISLREVHFYGTGITDSTKGEIITHGIRSALGFTGPIYAYSDVIAAARALCGHSPGIACILGTGSNSCLWDGESISFQIPPLGFWLGDEGSGGHLGKTLLQAYLHREIPVHLREEFELKYGAKDRLEILEYAYKKEKPNRYFAGFCPFLVEHIKEPWCYQLVQTSFRQFFEKYLLKYPQLPDSPLGAVGSVAWYFQAALQEVANEYGVHFHKIIQKPIDELTHFHSR